MLIRISSAHPVLGEEDEVWWPARPLVYSLTRLAIRICRPFAHVAHVADLLLMSVLAIRICSPFTHVRVARVWKRSVQHKCGEECARGSGVAATFLVAAAAAASRHTDSCVFIVALRV